MKCKSKRCGSTSRLVIAGAGALIVGCCASIAVAGDEAAPSAMSADPAVVVPMGEPRPAELPVRVRPPSFDRAQCENLCQMERDRGITACFVADNPNKPDDPRPVDCLDGGHKAFVTCIAQCPADFADVDGT